jgi:hypothetical protein
MQNLFEEDKEYLDNLEYISDKKEYWVMCLEARLAECTDPVEQKEILELLKEYK